MNYIAIDVSKQNLIVFDGKRTLKFANTKRLAQLRGILESHYRRSEVALIFEPTGPYSGYLIDLSVEMGLRAYIVNPAQFHWFRKSMGQRSKNDRMDAEALYKFATVLEKNGIEPARIDKSLRGLACLLSTYRHLQKLSRSIANHIESLSYNSDAHKEFIQTLKEEESRLEALMEKAFRKALQLIRKDDGMRQAYRRLKTIPGVGPKGALWLVWLFKRYEGANRRQMAALTGLDVVEKQSGTSVKGRTHISKHGHSAIRAVLYLPVYIAVKHNPAIGTFYERLVRQGKKPKLAAVACMRKLILIAYAIYKSGDIWKREIALRNAGLPVDIQDSI